MYTRCTYCHSALGTNEDVEPFPVGRRLAFDAAKGRLWVVCPACVRWNLTPLEERWEAIDACERLYSGTRRRFSTDNVGLARLASSLELIRVGKPLRPEFAAWRYGDRFGRRHRRFVVRSAALSGVSGATSIAFKLGFFTVPSMLMIGAGVVVAGELRRLYRKARQRLIVTRITSSDGVTTEVTRGDLLRLDLAPDADQRWALDLQRPSERIRLVEEAALHVGALALATLNAAGGSDYQVREAVKKLDWSTVPRECDALPYGREAYTIWDMNSAWRSRWPCTRMPSSGRWKGNSTSLSGGGAKRRNSLPSQIICSSRPRSRSG